MSEEQYDMSSKQITYGKLIDLLVEDFLTREDAKKMMESSNLPVNTTLQVNPGIAISGAAGSFPVSGATASPGTGSGTGQVSATYKGEHTTRSTGTRLMVAKRLREKMAGTAETEGALEAIDVAAGGELS
jgi:hypothetical protein